MDALIQDVRYALRTLRRTPGFTAAAVLSLALGIGANTAIFTVFNSALLRRLPVADPDALVRLSTQRGDNINVNFSYPHFEALRNAGVFAAVVARTNLPIAMRIGDATEQVQGAAVSSDFFETMGVPVLFGRTLADASVGSAPQTIVLSHALWQRLFAGRRDVLGETVRLNGQPFTVTGVAPASFLGLVRAVREDFWIPLTTYGVLTGSNFYGARTTSWLDVVARMKPGATLESTQARLSTVDGAMHERSFIGKDHHNLIEPAGLGFDWAVSELKQPLKYLMAAVVLVLLIACANVANLLLARTAARRQDLAIRAALGGDRFRLARQLLTESLLLGVVAGGTGLLLASWLTDALVAYRPSLGMPLVLDTKPDARVLSFTLIVSLLTGLVFGLGPAWQSARVDLMPLLKNTPGRVTERLRGRSILVIAQVALSLVLLAGAALLTRSLSRLSAVDLGFTTRNALLASIDLDAGGYTAQRGRPLIEALLERVRTLPGVVSASAATTINPSPGGSNYSGLLIDGYQAARDESVGFDVNVVEPAYFQTLGLPIVRGRGFSAADRQGGASVVVINEESARRYWPGRDPIGQRIYLDSTRTQFFEVIGIAHDGKYRELREEAATNAWRSMNQAYRAQLTLIVHTRGNPLDLAPALRSELRSLDAAIPLYDVKTLQQHINLATGRERMATRLASGFSALALLLATIGLYALLGYMVSQRTREIGVRMALGADRGEVLRHIMERGFKLVALGIGAGVPLSWAATRLLGSMVYGVSTRDAASLLIAIAVLSVAAAVAAYVPARRALSVDPLTALRAE